MARGYPDFFGYSIFPSYGLFLTHDQTIAPMLDTEDFNMIDIAGKGKVHGGYLDIDSLASMAGVSITITIDGVYYGTYIPFNDREDAIFAPGADLLWLMLYDPDSGHVVYGIAEGATFGQSFVINVENTSGANINVDASCKYYQVT